MTSRYLAIALLLVSCRNDTASTVSATRSKSANPAPDHVKAAEVFTDRYAHSRLSAWKVRAAAAGPRCDILTVEVATILDDSMVEAMHYGTGAYDVYQGGVQRFYLQRGFKGVAYKDESRRIWTYGEVTVPRAETLAPCH